MVGPSIHLLAPGGGADLVVRFAAVAIAALVGLALGLAVVERDERRGLVGLVVAALVSRLLVPKAFLQPDLDDVREAALMRGIDLSGIGGTARPPPDLARLTHAVSTLFGDGIATVFAPARFAGTLLPIVGYLVARQWLGDRRQALIAGALLLLSPVACAHSATITAEMPAALLYALVLFFGTLAVDGPGPRRLAIVVAAGALVLAAGLKEELALAIPLSVLTLAWRARGGDEPKLGYALALLPALAATVAHFAFQRTHPESLAEWRSHVLGPGHVLFYLIATLLLNPPFLPAKIGFYLGARRRRELLPFVVHVLGYLALFATAFQTFGFNHWRYALSSQLPFALVLAPVCASAWSSSRRRLLWLAGVELVLGFGVYLAGNARPRMRDLAALEAWSPAAPAALTYAPYRQDRDPGALVAFVRKSDAIALSELWPPSCRPAVDQRRIQVRSEYRDLCRKASLDRTRFLGIDDLERDIVWFRAQPLPDWLLRGMEPKLELGPPADEAACRAALPAWREALARYRSLALLVDAEYATEHGLLGKLGKALVGVPPDTRSEHIERAARYLRLGGEIPPSGGIVPVRAVLDPIDPTRAPLWGQL